PGDRKHRKIVHKERTTASTAIKSRATALVPRKRKMVVSETTKFATKRAKTHNTRSKSKNKEIETQTPVTDQESRKPPVNHTAEVPLNSIEQNASKTEDTEALYEAGETSLQKNLTTSSIEESENSMADVQESSRTQAADPESDDSEGIIKIDLETMRIEDKKSNKTKVVEDQDQTLEVTDDQNRSEVTEMEKVAITHYTLNQEIICEEVQNDFTILKNSEFQYEQTENLNIIEFSLNNYAEN
ncbi:4646_t:CDS:2, partial [Cetraspora pellucida]